MIGKKLNLIFDFDSTFVKLEALDELAGIALRNKKDKKKILEEIKKITALGMEGVISFPESLSKRFKLLSADKRHIDKLIGLLKKNITDSVKKNKKFFKKNHKNIYIISGGFREYIYPVAANFGIKTENILANKLIFDKSGKICGFDKKEILAQKNGKVRQVKKMKLKGETWVIGDGYTDYQIRQSGVADRFIAFFENIKRDSVAKKADQIVYSFDEFLAHNNLE